MHDGHTKYFAKHGNRISSLPKYDPLEIEENFQYAKFRDILRFHQEGKSDYFTFCKEVVKAEIAKWMVDVEFR